MLLGALVGCEQATATFVAAKMRLPPIRRIEFLGISGGRGQAGNTAWKSGASKMITSYWNINDMFDMFVQCPVLRRKLGRYQSSS